MRRILHDKDIDKSDLYHPSHELDKTKPSIPVTVDIQLPPKRKINNIQNKSGNQDIDSVITCRQQAQILLPKKKTELLDAEGTTLPLNQTLVRTNKFRSHIPPITSEHFIALP